MNLYNYLFGEQLYKFKKVENGTLKLKYTKGEPWDVCTKCNASSFEQLHKSDAKFNPRANMANILYLINKDNAGYLKNIIHKKDIICDMNSLIKYIELYDPYEAYNHIMKLENLDTIFALFYMFEDFNENYFTFNDGRKYVSKDVANLLIYTMLTHHENRN